MSGCCCLPLGGGGGAVGTWAAVLVSGNLTQGGGTNNPTLAAGDWFTSVESMLIQPQPQPDALTLVGDLMLRSGESIAGGVSGNVEISSASPVGSGRGGSISIVAPNTLNLDAPGGSITTQAGNGFGNSVGGALTASAGNGAGGASGGAATINGGDGGPGGAGGPCLIEAGNAGFNTGGEFRGKAGDGNVGGGQASIIGGSGGSAGGGDALLTAGSSISNNGPGGDAIITAGAPNGAGSDGRILLNTPARSYIWPGAGGSPNQVLIENGAGSLGWGDVVLVDNARVDIPGGVFINVAAPVQVGAFNFAAALSGWYRLHWYLQSTFGSVGPSGIFECIQNATILGNARYGLDVDGGDNFVFTGWKDLNLVGGVNDFYQIQAWMAAPGSSITVSQRRMSIERLGS